MGDACRARCQDASEPKGATDIEHVLVTGGTGTLGREVVDNLLVCGITVRVLSRRPQLSGSPEVEWTIGDLRKGEGIDEALQGIDTVIHCASRFSDATSARHLLRGATNAERPFIVYISIVGVDRVPLRYYRSKLEVERLIERSELPWTTLRSTQFHNLIAGACRTLARSPVMFLPAQTSFQPIDVKEVATRLVELASAAPAERVPDMGGPEILGTGELAASYLDAAVLRRPFVPVRLPGKAFAGFREGGHLAPEHAVGTVTFEEFLAERFATR
jgi:uncharacterized protein YbjT (DUF2867 family)